VIPAAAPGCSSGSAPCSITAIVAIMLVPLPARPRPSRPPRTRPRKCPAPLRKKP
jgi:hypothetical protein